MSSKEQQEEEQHEGEEEEERKIEDESDDAKFVLNGLSQGWSSGDSDQANDDEQESEYLSGIGTGNNDEDDEETIDDGSHMAKAQSVVRKVLADAIHYAEQIKFDINFDEEKIPTFEEGQGIYLADSIELFAGNILSRWVHKRALEMLKVVTADIFTKLMTKFG